MSKTAEMELTMALSSTGVVQPVSSKTKGGKLEVTCRAVPGQDKVWLDAIKAILGTIPPEDEAHLCRQYLLKDGELVYGWHIAITSEKSASLDDLVKVLVGVLANVRPSKPTEPKPEKAKFHLPLAPGVHPPKKSHPRSPGDPSTAKGPSQVTITTEVHRDSKGRPIVIKEMPIPHVSGDMNRTNAKGKGAEPV